MPSLNDSRERSFVLITPFTFLRKVYTYEKTLCGHTDGEGKLSGGQFTATQVEDKRLLCWDPLNVD